MSNQTDEVPQLGRNMPAIVASDSHGEVKRKIDEYLSKLRVAFEARHQQAVADGDADSPNYVPMCGITVTVAYDGSASAGNLISNANLGLVEVINSLPEHGFFLVDVEEWQRVNLTLDHGATPSPYGYTIGVQYTVKVADTRGEDNYRAEAGAQWVEAANMYDRGELVTHAHPSESTRNGSPVEALLRALAERHGGDNIH